MTHFHFVGWPDHGVPLLATSLLEFRRKVRAHDDHASGPLLVHCRLVGYLFYLICFTYGLYPMQIKVIASCMKLTQILRVHDVMEYLSFY